VPKCGLLAYLSYSGADSIGNGGARVLPPLLRMAGHEGHREYRKTANKKLIKLYCPSRKRSPKRLIVLLEPKKWRDTTKKIPAPFAGSVPPTFEPDRCPPLSNSFRRHCLARLIVTLWLLTTFESAQIFKPLEINISDVSITHQKQRISEKVILLTRCYMLRNISFSLIFAFLMQPLTSVHINW